MTSREKSKKRRLPAWMEVVNNKTKNHTAVADEDTCASTKALKNDSDLDVRSNILPPVSTSVCASSVITNSMPFLLFPGRVVYCYNFPDCACFCEEILISVREKDTKTVVGFDMEWPVSFSKGSSEKTALIQMCFSEEKCYLFHVSAIGKFPKLLGDLITDEQLILVGLNIETDLWKLERDFDIHVKPLIDRCSMVDIGKLANEKLRSAERWNLDGLCKNVLKKRLNKDTNIRCGTWTDVPLSEDQKNYAVADAYAGLKIYKNLNREIVS